LDLRGRKWQEAGENCIMRYASQNIRLVKSRDMRCARYATHMGEMRNSYNILVRKPEGKRPHKRTRHRWKDTIRTYLRGIGWRHVD
jgi:hypothetical protein